MMIQASYSNEVGTVDGFWHNRGGCSYIGEITITLVNGTKMHVPSKMPRSVEGLSDFLSPSYLSRFTARFV